MSLKERLHAATYPPCPPVFVGPEEAMEIASEPDLSMVLDAAWSLAEDTRRFLEVICLNLRRAEDLVAQGVAIPEDSRAGLLVELRALLQALPLAGHVLEGWFESEVLLRGTRPGEGQGAAR